MNYASNLILETIESLGKSTTSISTLNLTVAATVAALLASVYSMGFFSGKSRFDPVGKHCYIGGGSEGLGLALACQLVAKGAHVSIVSRSKDKLIKALAEIETHRTSPTQRIVSYSCDLTSSSDAAKTLRLACVPFSDEAPSYLFACAGGCIPTLFTDMTVEQHWKCMEWNFLCALNTIHEGVKMMRDEREIGSAAKTDGIRVVKSGDARVVLTGSVLSMMGFVGYSSYSPSKYAIRGLAESLRNELLLYNISVHLFLPATIFSPGFANEQALKPEITKLVEGPDEGVTPSDAAAHLIKGLERDEFYTTYEPVGNMLRNSRGITPRNNVLFDTFWGIAGSIALPIWRMMSADGEVYKAAKKASP